jgi:CheY-like chemotaxis protein
VINKLEDKEIYLDRCVTLLNFALTAIGFAKNQQKDAKAEAKDGKKTAVGMFLENNAEARDFWSGQFGDKILVTWDSMAAAMTKTKAFGPMDKESLFVMQLQLDENKDGNISLYEFANFVGTNKLLDALEAAAGSEAVSVIKEKQKAAMKTPEKKDTNLKSPQDKKVTAAAKVSFDSGKAGPLPNLIWIDPNPQNNKAIRDKCETKGLTVLCVDTAKDAIAYLEGEEQSHPKVDRQDKALLRNSKLRFMSNNKIYSMEQDFSDMSAAEELIRFLRKKRSQAPVLIYCGYTLPKAKKFLEDGKYPLCTATDKAPEAEEYACGGHCDWAVLEPRSP